MIEILISIMLVASVFLCGTIAGMNLVDKMYRKTIEDTARLIDEYDEMNEKLKDSNIGLTQIITGVLNENDYASAKYIKNKIKEALDDASKQY